MPKRGGARSSEMTEKEEKDPPSIGGGHPVHRSGGHVSSLVRAAG
jgi:hypothetical protein